MQVFKNYDDVLEGVISAFSYNRDKHHLIEVLKQVKNRLQNGPYELPISDADLMMSILVSIYGDYGTSPRYGWFYIKQLPEEFIKIIDNEITELIEFIELYEEEEEEEEDVN